MNPSKPRILLIVHQYHNRAGIEFHVKILSRILADRFDMFLVFPDNGKLHLVNQATEIAVLPADPVSILAPHRSQSVEQAMVQILHHVQPQLLHIVHFVFWPLSLFDLTIKSNIPWIASFHDYFLLTPYWTMQGVEDVQSTTSAEHAMQFFGKDISEYLKERREFLRSRISHAKALVCPSDHLITKLKSVFEFDFLKIPYGIPLRETAQPERTNSQQLRIGFFGSFIPQKGLSILLQGFALAYQKNQNISLQIFGGQPPESFSAPGVEFKGPYEPHDIMRVSNEIDIAVIPSLFEETYSIVLSELWDAKIVPVASAIGALKDRIVDGSNGKLFEAGNPESLAEALLWFKTTDEWRSWALPTPYSEEEMGDAYEQLYRKALQ